ncbi:uncharacterized protein [Parasteatoda tepidariorum]|uniref:uncharacterized protein n=1 Tax=Parasteatoda tepidariorum TaxID=114398 RepID=UPI0039BD3BBC
MELMIKKRSPIRGNFSKTYNALTKLLAEENPQEENIRVNYANLERIYQSLAILDNEICETLLDTSEQQKYDDQYNAIEEYNKNVVTLYLVFKKLSYLFRRRILGKPKKSGKLESTGGILLEPEEETSGTSDVNPIWIENACEQQEESDPGWVADFGEKEFGLTPFEFTNEERDPGWVADFDIDSFSEDDHSSYESTTLDDHPPIMVDWWNDNFNLVNKVELYFKMRADSTGCLNLGQPIAFPITTLEYYEPPVNPELRRHSCPDEGGKWD